MAMATRPVNVLCLDGGGLAISSNLLTEPLPCEVFDMICGTSTGGVIALMLGRLRMNVDDAIARYLEFSRTVFGKRRSIPPPPQPPLGFWSRLLRRTSSESHTSSGSHASLAIYDASKLEQWIQDIVAKYGGDGEAPLRDPVDGFDDFCHTFVVATTKDYADAPPKLFRTYRTEGRSADPCKMWEAARATTAAAPFFEPATFGLPQATYVDGSFSGSNNPSRLAIDEANEVFPSRQVGCFLSLGTGVPDVIAIGGGLDEVAEACMKLIKSCEVVQNTVWKDFAKRKKAGEHAGVYFRFSVDRGLGKVELDEWNREADLAGITDGYMRYSEVEEKGVSCVETLTARAVETAAKKRDGDDLL